MIVSSSAFSHHHCCLFFFIFLPLRSDAYFVALFSDADFRSEVIDKVITSRHKNAASIVNQSVAAANGSPSAAVEEKKNEVDL